MKLLRQKEKKLEHLLAVDTEKQEDIANSFGRVKLKHGVDFPEFIKTGHMEFELDQAGTELFDNEDENWDKDDSCQSNGNGMDSSYPTDESNKKKSDQAPVDASHQASHTINENSQEPKLSLNEFHRVTLKTFSKNPKTTMGYRTHLDRSAKCPTNSEGMTPITDDGELLKKILRPGNGRKPPFGAQVFIHYRVYSENNLEKPIDSTYERKKPFSFKLFNHDVLAALEYGVATMEVKERCKLSSSPHYAYGPLGIPGICGPGTRCVFLVELIHFTDESFSEEVLNLDSADRAKIGFGGIMKAATELKDKGNSNMGKGMRQSAMQCYRKAILILERHLLVDRDEDASRNELLFVLYSNLAQCYLELGDGRRAVSMCVKANELPPETKGNRCKLGFREAKGHIVVGNVDLAKKACRRALDFEPGNSCINVLYEQIVQSASSENKKTDDLYKKMFPGV